MKKKMLITAVCGRTPVSALSTNVRQQSRTTESELQKVVSGSDKSIKKLGISERINTVIKNAKNSSYLRGIDMVLNECDNILCEPLENLTSDDKDVLLGTLAQYTFLKRSCSEEKQDNLAMEEDEVPTFGLM